MMTTKTRTKARRKRAAKRAGKSDAMKFLDKLIGEPISFGRLVRTTRETDDYTLATLASKLGVSRQYLSDIEHGRRNVSVETAAKRGELLGYAASYWVQVALQTGLDANHLPYRV